jgi:Cys-tRNA(Pro)/Cys-tRNA(Cys) deacylase
MTAMDTAITRFLRQHEIAHELHHHPGLTAAADITAAAPPFPRAQWVKTLVFESPAGLVLAALPALARLDYAALAAASGVRRADLGKAGPQALAGLDVTPGGAGPFPLAPGSRLIMDGKVPILPVIYVGGGRPDLTVEIAPKTLLAHVKAAIAPISKA